MGDGTYSLARRAAVYMSIFMTLMIMGAMGLELADEMLEMRRDTELRLENYSYYLREQLGQPIWNMDREGVESICRAFTTQMGLASLTVKGGGVSGIFFHYEKDILVDTLSLAAPIMYGGREIGEVRLVLDRAAEQRQLERRVLYSVIFLIFIAGTSMAVIDLLISRLLRAPLHTLMERINSYPRRMGAGTEQAGRVREFRWIVKHFDMLVDQIEARQGALEGAQRELRKSYAFSQMIMDNTAALLIVSDRSGRIVHFNPAMGRLVGYRLEEAEGRPYWEILYPDKDGVEIGRRLEKVTEENLEREIVRTVTDRRGKQHQILWFNTLQTDERGQVQSFISSGLDVTELEKIRKNQGELERQILQQQKTESIGKLAAGVAHDFNNILTVLIGFTDLALAGMGPEDAAYGPLQQINTANERARNLVGQLLAFSRKKAFSPRVTNATALVAELEKMLRRLAGERIEFEMVMSEEQIRVNADPSQLEQIVMNLVVNARDAILMHGGAEGAGERRIGVSTHLSRIEEVLECQDSRLMPGSYLEIRVEDSGCGIPENRLNEIFEPFFTTKAEGEGTGLGLATILSIAGQNSAHIRVESQVGKGSRFIVYWPAVEVSEAAYPDELPLPGTLPGGQESILYVEDDDIIRDMTAGFLEEAGYRVLTASDGWAAYELMQRTEERIELLLTDYVLPQMSGAELIRALREENAQLPVLICTGFNSELPRDLESGASGSRVLHKPYTRREMLEAVRGILDDGALREKV